MSIAFECRDKGSIVAELHIGVVRTAPALRRYPGDILIRVLDIAGFAMDAVLRVDDIARLASFLDPFIDAGRAIARRGPAIAVVLGGFLHKGIGQSQMHGLVLLVIRVGEED
jgi:hypothetical protein